MSENCLNTIPHIRIPRSLSENDLWINLPLGYREVFIAILDHVCFKPQKFDDHGVIIDLMPGQVCASIREITKWLGKYADKNIVERSIKKFILYQFVRQEVRHKKTIITISHSDTYELIKRACETPSETILRQSRDKLETQKNNVNNVKKEKEYITPSASLHAPQNSSSDEIHFLDHSNQALDQTNQLKGNLNETLTDLNLGMPSDFDAKMQHNLYYQEQSLTKTNKKTSKLNKTKTKSEEYRKSLVDRRENIQTSDEEHNQLIEKYGIDFVNTCYDYLCEWKKSKSLNDPKAANAHSDFYRINRWVAKTLKEEKLKSTIDANQSNSIEKNKKLAMTAFQIFHSVSYRMEILSKVVEFVPLSNGCTDVLSFSENGFKDQLDGILRKRKFERKLACIDAKSA